MRLLMSSLRTAVVGATFLGATVLGATLPTSANAAVLTFADATCGGGSCGNGGQIDQTYGDIAGQLDVIWNNGAGGDVYHWDNYSGLPNVAYGVTNGAVEVFLKPLSGYDVTLLGFDIGSYLNISRTTSVRVLSGDLSTTYLDTGAVSVGATPLSYAFNLTSSDGFRIQFGPDAYNVGISNIAFNVSPTGGTGAVPEPGAWALMIGGFGLAGSALRRRRATATA